MVVKTVTAQRAVTVPTEATILVDPLEIAVTLPVASTVATAVFVDIQRMFLFTSLDTTGNNCAVKTCVESGFKRTLFLFKLIDVMAFVTVTAQVAE